MESTQSWQDTGGEQMMDDQLQAALLPAPVPSLPVVGSAGLTPTLTPTGALAQGSTAPIESPSAYAMRRAMESLDTEQPKKNSDATNLSLYGAISKDPDSVAKLQEVARKLGVPTGIASLDEPKAKRDQRLKEINDLNLAQVAPILEERLRNPEFADIAHDDLQVLSDIERFTNYATDTQGMGQQFDDTWNQTEESKFWVRMMESDIGFPKQLVNPEDQKAWKYYMALEGNTIDSLPEGLAYLSAQIASTSEEVAASAVVGGAVGGVSGAVGGLGLGSAVTAPVGVAAGMGLGAEVGMFTSMSKLEAGLLYKELIRNGVDRKDAKLYAEYGGMAMGGLELVSLKTLSSPLRAAAKSYITSVLAKKTMKGAVKKVAKEYVKAAAAEIGIELIQENVTITTEELSRRYSGGNFKPLFTWDGGERYLDRMGNVAQQTFTTIALFGGFFPSAAFAVDYANVRETQKAEAYLKLIASNSEDSALRARAPNAFLEFLAKQSEGKSGETMYVNAERLREILRKSELTGEQIDQALPGVRAKLGETLTSADIEIPTAQFATTVVGTVLEAPLMRAVRLDPKAHSVEELIALQAEQAEYLKDAEATLLAQVETNANAVVEAKAVHTAAKAAFVAAGREETQAHADAMFYRAYIIRLAGELKVSVAEAARLFPLPTIVGVGQAAAASALAPARPTVAPARPIAAAATSSAAAATVTTSTTAAAERANATMTVADMLATPATATTNAAEALPPVSPVTTESLREVATANVASTTATMQQVRDNAVAERRGWRGCGATVDPRKQSGLCATQSRPQLCGGQGRGSIKRNH
jgi:Large polyvalent protein associated domain 22